MRHDNMNVEAKMAAILYILKHFVNTTLYKIVNISRTNKAIWILSSDSSSLINVEQAYWKKYFFKFLKILGVFPP